jgi:hypothetical protein
MSCPWLEHLSKAALGTDWRVDIDKDLGEDLLARERLYMYVQVFLAHYLLIFTSNSYV